MLHMYRLKLALTVVSALLLLFTTTLLLQQALASPAAPPGPARPSPSAVAAAAATTDAAELPASSPAEKDGLSIVIQPLAATFAPGDALALKVTFKNVSPNTFRLPDKVAPAPYHFWYLKLVSVDTGKRYIGASTLPMGAAPEPGQITPVALPAGKSADTTVTFQRFGFAEGATDFNSARSIMMPMPRPPGPQPSTLLPPGKYTLALNVTFQSYPDHPGTPERVLAAKAAIDNDPVPLWKGQEILSNPIEITIAAPPAPPTTHRP